MAKKDRFLIGFVDSNASIQTDVKPWLIADNAWALLKNVYPFRGRIRKRFGGLLTGSGAPTSFAAPYYSRAAILVGTTTGGALSGNVRTITSHPAMITKVGQMFSVNVPIVNPGDNGITLFTVYNPAGGAQQMLRTDGSVSTATYNLTNSAFNITNIRDSAGNLVPNGTNVYFYTAEPIMGISIFQSGNIDAEPTYIFDQNFAYTFNGSFWQMVGSGGTPIWHGSNINFVWTTTWYGAGTQANDVFYVTNFNASVPAPGATDDPIWYYKLATNTWVAASGANAFYFAPAGGAVHTGPFVSTAKMILPFHGRLILLNTIENDGSGNTSAYQQRVRFSWRGDPLATQAWYEPNQTDSSGNFAGGAGFLDADTEEMIIGAQFIKDNLIVFFERSTWQLAYTGNEVQPFQWYRINTELGAVSAFSVVPFDKQTIAIGETGVHACNGANVQRIDDKIPQEIFEMINVYSAVERVAGIRDFYVEQVYWTLPSVSLPSAETYPDTVVVYNYKTGAWALNNDCITAFGYFQQESATTWAQPGYISWEQSDFDWQSGLNQSNVRQTLCGNQEGFVFIAEPNIGRNAPVMQITNITAASPYVSLNIIDHTLALNECIYIENVMGTTGLNGNIYFIQSITDANNVVINNLLNNVPISGVYTGGGTVTRVSNIGMISKQYNPYVQDDRNVYISRVDFGVDRTSVGQLTVDYYPSYTSLSMLNEGEDTGTILGTGVLETSPYNPIYYPLEQLQDSLWHPLYFQTSGEAIQLVMYMNPIQISTPTIAFSDFQLNGMVLYAEKTTDRLQ